MLHIFGEEKPKRTSGWLCVCGGESLPSFLSRFSSATADTWKMFVVGCLSVGAGVSEHVV